MDFIWSTVRLTEPTFSAPGALSLELEAETEGLTGVTTSIDTSAIPSEVLPGGIDLTGWHYVDGAFVADGRSFVSESAHTERQSKLTVKAAAEPLDRAFTETVGETVETVEGVERVSRKHDEEPSGPGAVIATASLLLVIAFVPVYRRNAITGRYGPKITLNFARPALTVIGGAAMLL